MVAVGSCLSVCAAATGCLDFGGPLVADDDDPGDGDDDDTSAETSSNTTSDHRCGPTSGVVDRVIDGDTILLESGDRVRYILVDTPEITAGKNECWGTEASAYNQQLVEGHTISIEYDQECEDQYGRLLAYVSVDGMEVNRALLEGGFACILHISPNGDAKFTAYQNLENAAKQAGTGMWSACAKVTCEW
ncbi:Endonuclease YncB precursor [Enhygromyxa salina]|uniref:Endonuclease YncB n=2 Tax=Enhygromyxa salina TaxID=215803 RepID=A0A2S9YWJ4_9BACT|nr:Endonuclease YncB precursor [Enhygromyxa salina]